MTKPDKPDYLWDREGEPDVDVARLEELLSPLAHRAPLDELKLRRRSRMPMFVAIATAVAATLALVLWWRWPRDEHYEGVACTGFGFVFNGKGGDVKCNGVALAVGVVPVTGTLDTGAGEASLTIADIGSAQLGAGTRVRLDRSHYAKDPKDSRHQLFLEHGRMHAKVNALPKIFAVATPSADVVDLGCEYVLELDRTGAGSIRVMTGKVELETGTGSVVMAPAGTHARLLPGRRASIPLSDRAGPKIAAAVAQFEAGSPDALGNILMVAQLQDAITIANLARVVPVAQRRTVLSKLAEIVCPPQDMTIDDALSDKDLFDMWFDEVWLVHIGESKPGCRIKP